MNTPTTNYIEIDGEGKYIEDTDCREMATQNAEVIAAINAKIPASASASNKMATNADITAINNLLKPTTAQVATMATHSFISFTIPQAATSATLKTLAILGLTNLTNLNITILLPSDLGETKGSGFIMTSSIPNYPSFSEDALAAIAVIDFSYN